LTHQYVFALIYFNFFLNSFYQKSLQLRKIGILTNLIEKYNFMCVFSLLFKNSWKKVQPGARIISTDPVNIVSTDTKGKLAEIEIFKF